MANIQTCYVKYNCRVRVELKPVNVLTLNQCNSYSVTCTHEVQCLHWCTWQHRVISFSLAGQKLKSHRVFNIFWVEFFSFSSILEKALRVQTFGRKKKSAHKVTASNCSPVGRKRWAQIVGGALPIRNRKNKVQTSNHAMPLTLGIWIVLLSTSYNWKYQCENTFNYHSIRGIYYLPVFPLLP